MSILEINGKDSAGNTVSMKHDNKSDSITDNAQFMESSYPKCIDFHEIDLTAGCDIRCIYCGLYKRDLSKSLKINQVLNGPIPEKGIYLSPNSDPFAMKARQLTHKILERFLPEGVPFSIITKSQIPNETIKLLAKYPELVIPQISLSRLDQELNDYIEPGADSASVRLDTIKKLSDAGLRVRCLAMPLYPEVDDTVEKLNELVKAYAKTGGYCVKASYVVIRFGQTKKDIEVLKKMESHPQLRRSIEVMIETIKVQIGEGNVPSIERRIQLYENLRELCQSYGLKFLACSVLDPPLLHLKEAEFPICKSIWTFQDSSTD